MTVDEEEYGLSRDGLIEVLRAENVLARRYFYPGCHRMKPYSAMHEYAAVRLPATDEVAARVVVMPTGPQLVEGAVARIGHILRRAAASTPPVSSALARAR
jgi:dTDP-4-amino-4,6-dideoxygalactose transaminase